MNHVPDFEIETDDDYLLPALAASLNKPTKSAMERSMGDITELMWQNGQPVQTHNRSGGSRKGEDTPTMISREIRSAVEEETLPANVFMQEEEMASWLHYPIEDATSLERYLYGASADLLYPEPQPPAASAITTVIPPPPPSITVPSPRPPLPPSKGEPSQPKYTNFSHFTNIARAVELGPSTSRQMPLVSAVVDSNYMPSPEALDSRAAIISGSNMLSGGGVSGVGETAAAPAAVKEAEACEQSASSSPVTGSGASASVERSPLKAPAPPNDRKRRGLETDEADGQSEDVECDSPERKKHTRRPGATKRSRAAEVHNLSERRRRDRINEKMKALQELIPRCNKADKASMLDEAIEYLKSLQLQVQMMSMGCSMVPMMFPGVQQYMPQMPMGMSMRMGMGMDMGMNRGVVPYLPGSTLPNPSASVAASAAAVQQLGNRFPVPGFHMPPAPGAGHSRTQAPNLLDPMIMFPPPNPNQPPPPHYTDQFQQFLRVHPRPLSLPLGLAQNPATTLPSTSKPSSSGKDKAPEHQQTG